MATAAYRRKMQFDSGPQKQVFYACEECLPLLQRGYLVCFSALKGEPVQPCGPAEDDITCDLCQDGGHEDYYDY